MSQVAFRRDTEDPEIVREFAALVGTEERLKLLCLMTLADVEAVSPDTLTPWKEELLWRLYVDTYNYLTLQLRRRPDRPHTGRRRRVRGAPPRRSRRRRGRRVSRRTAAPLPAALRSPRRSIDTCGWRATSIPTKCTCGSSRATTAWQLTVVTLDKPMLFANICGVLSSFGMDILRGHAMTNPNGLVLDVFQFTDGERFLELNPGALRRGAPRHRGRRRRTIDRVGSAARPASEGSGAAAPRRSRRSSTATASSRRYTVLEIVAAMSSGCSTASAGRSRDAGLRRSISC